MTDNIYSSRALVQKLSLSRCLEYLSYQSKPAELIFYFLTISGLALWDGFALSWAIQKPILAAHFLVSILLFPLFVVPFWLTHRKIIERSNKAALRLTGRLIDYTVVLLLASGIYLGLVGNRGNLIGELAYWSHLLPAIPMALLTLYHAKRWSMVKSLKWMLVLCLAFVFLIGSAFAATQSGSLVINDEGNKLYSANFDVGTVSWLDRASGERLGEINIGQDIRRISLGADQLVGATDYTGNKVVFFNWQEKKIVSSFKLDSRPFGIVYDQKNELYWVSVFESHQLVAIHPDKGVVVSLETEETPRGLALLSDGRLLVTHSLIGKVSIYDTHALPPKLIKTIVLHETQEPQELISQGLPRLLDDIALSPDETEAWLPHLLWNFDHLFQFQSTVFPSVSLLQLTPGNERELATRRKHLFRQIKIKDGDKKKFDGSPKDMIVSNPHDASFSADGERVYVTLAASEDLMVFDLSAREEIKPGEQQVNDAKVSQLLRNYPGRNPRGVLVVGNEVFVQNAMSLDLTRIVEVKDDAQAHIKISHGKFTSLVKEDTVEPSLRRGKTLFFSANTERNPEYPMSGDFWMSCQSCHVDGFNFTNGYLYRDTPVDKYKYTRIGHGNLSNMIAGNFVSDYLNIIQGTQGGMGHDGEGTAEFIDPEEPPAEVVSMMADLHQMVTSKGNLPLVSTWLRLDDERKTVHAKEWTNSAACAECHSDMFDQWSDSLHRLMGDSNPYYKVVEDVAAATEGEAFRKWCMGCHHPQGLLSGLNKTSNQGHMFEQGGASLFEALEKGEPDLDEGTGCLFCHRITNIEAAQGKKAGANASFTVNLKDRETFIFEDSPSPVLNWVGNHSINAKPAIHAKSYSQDFYDDSALCSSCHNEFAPGSGSLIVDTYGEWERSSYNNPQEPENHRSCIDCHMHADIEKIGEDIPGISTDGGRVKKNVVTHQFTGANYHLVGLRNKKLEKMSIQLLQSAAELEAYINASGALTIRVKNVGAGHALPTGVADFRQLWLDLTVKDANNEVVLESGKMNDKGVVDPNARFFQKVFGDKYGEPVGFAFWRFEKMLKDTKIPANGHRDEAFTLPGDVVFPISVDVKLMFRTYPQFVTDIVREQYPELTNPDAVTMVEITSHLAPPAGH